MKLQSLTPMLASTDLERTVNFYTGVLGFRIIGSFGEPRVWCCLERDGVEIMFNAPPRECILNDVSPKSREYQIFYFRLNDVAALHRDLKTRGVTVSDLRVMPYRQKEFDVRDPEGYWLMFAQETDEPPTITEEDLKDRD